MDRLIDIDGTTRSVAIDALIPRLDGIKIKNLLLDGTYHIQTIGEPRKEIDFICYAEYGDMMEINRREFEGESFTVEYEGRSYTGKIYELDEWDVEIDHEAGERVYKTEIKVVVETEELI